MSNNTSITGEMSIFDFSSNLSIKPSCVLQDNCCPERVFHDKKVKDLLDWTPTSLAKLKNMGRKSVREIQEELAKHGLKLKEDLIEVVEPPPKQSAQLPPMLQNEMLYALTSAVLNALALSGEPQIYSDVAPIIGYYHRDRNFHIQLGRSLREDHANGRPLRASLVINKALGMPGDAYFKVCRELGYVIPSGDEATFWAEQLKRLEKI